MQSVHPAKIHRSGHKIVLPTLLILLLALIGCNGEFTDASLVSGLAYHTDTQAGTTDDGGAFRFRPNETITFAIGDLVLGSGLATCTSEAPTAKTATVVRPVRTSPRSEESGRTYRFHRSIVKIVEAAFSMDASELTTAPRRAARMKPCRPTPDGTRRPMSSGSAVSYL